MEPRNKKSKYLPWTIISLTCVIISIIAKCIITAGRTNFVIQQGIKTYRGMQTFTTILLVISIIAFLITLTLYLITVKQNIEAQNAPKDQNPNAILSVSKSMDSNKMKALLYNTCETLSGTVPQSIFNNMNQCIKLLNKMDDYQSRLTKLLQTNGVDGLDDTEDLLNQVEQYICKKVRSIINYISITDTSVPEHVNIIDDKLKTCVTDVENQLKQVQEFLFVLTDFLNKQGEDDATPEQLDIYKSLILKSVNDEDDIL